MSTPLPKLLPDPKEYPELLLEMHAIVCNTLEKYPQIEPHLLSTLIIESIRKNFSGMLIYCPSRYFEVAVMRKEIKQKFNGNNINALAREYKISVNHVYRLLRQADKNRA